jgi:hypothetical protein
MYKIVHLPTATNIWNDLEPDGKFSDRFYTEYEKTNCKNKDAFNFVDLFPRKSILSRLKCLLVENKKYFYFDKDETASLPEHFEIVKLEKSNGKTRKTRTRKDSVPDLP